MIGHTPLSCDVRIPLSLQRHRVCIDLLKGRNEVLSMCTMQRLVSKVRLGFCAPRARWLGCLGRLGVRRYGGWSVALPRVHSSHALALAGFGETRHASRAAQTPGSIARFSAHITGR